MSLLPVREAQIVVTGLGWVGRGIRSVDSVLIELITSARREILITAFSVTSGSDPVLRILRRKAMEGLEVVLLVDRFKEQPEGIRHRLARMARLHRCFQILCFEPSNPNESLHAKTVVVDREKLLLGSPNLSHRGLVSNHEMAVVLEGAIASTTARVIDRLRQNKSLVRALEMAEYE